jgi:hypothetical protein
MTDAAFFGVLYTVSELVIAMSGVQCPLAHWQHGHFLPTFLSSTQTTALPSESFFQLSIVLLCHCVSILFYLLMCRMSDLHQGPIPLSSLLAYGCSVFHRHQGKYTIWHGHAFPSGKNVLFCSGLQP